MDIPPRQYERPTIQPILMFASGEFSRDKAAAFVRSFGYLRRLPVVKQSRTFSLSDLQPNVSLDDQPGSPWSEPVLEWSGADEGVALWQEEWTAMNAFAGLYDSIMQHPSERTVPSVAINVPEGQYRGDRILSHDEMEELYIVDETAENAELRKAAARLVAAKLDENTPLSGYSLVDGVLARWTAGTLLFHIWTTFLYLASGKREAKRCSVCGVWEVKGGGYTRSNWTVHPACSNARRQREFRSREKERDRAALEAVRRVYGL